MLDLIYSYKYELVSLGVLTIGMYMFNLKRAKKSFQVLKTLRTRMDDKTVIVTGANTGIGYETALELAKRGARVVLACRDEQKASLAVQKIKQISNNQNVSFEFLDLSSLETVKRFADNVDSKYQNLDVLINNAGL